MRGDHSLLNCNLLTTLVSLTFKRCNFLVLLLILKLQIEEIVTYVIVHHDKNIKWSMFVIETAIKCFNDNFYGMRLNLFLYKLFLIRTFLS